jgi:hypothetical protein
VRPATAIVPSPFTQSACCKAGALPPL